MWIASLPCEERPMTFTTHWRTGWKQSAPSLLAWGPAEWVTESLLLAGVSRPTSLQGSPLGTDYNHLLRAIPLTRQIKSYKLSNRKNTRTTGQNDQILTMLGIYNPQTAADAPSWELRRCRSSVQGQTCGGFISTGVEPMDLWVQKLQGSVWLLLLHFLCLQFSSIWENLWDDFLVWVVYLLADLLFQNLQHIKS